MPVIVLAGEEEFALTKRVAQLKETLLTPPWQVVNFLKLNKPSLSALRESAGTLAFGQGNRIVLIDNCDFFTKKRTKSQSANDATSDSEDNKTSKSAKSNNPDDEELEAIITSVPENTYLVFSCPYNFDTTLKLSKLVSKHAKIEEFTKEKYFPGSRNPKLESFCRQEAKKYGATINDAAIDYLLVSTEGNFRQLASEIEKVSLSILPKTNITYDEVAAICSTQGHIFQFIDFWLNKQTAQALSNLADLLNQQNAMPILATLQTMLSKWIKLKALYETYASQTNKSSENEIAKLIASDLKLMPFSVEKDLRRLQKYSASQLVDKRLQLTRLEYAIKTGQIPGDHALTMFVSSK